jgi:hypothetical protein
VARLTVHLIPHTHWDREWYLPRAAFVARLVPALDDLFDRLDASPQFRSFLLDGQTILLEDYLKVRPEQRDRVAALVRNGRLQVGPWYVLADELIPSGESLVRNLLLGRADAERLGGRTDVLYSPDAFGHPAIWPALAAEFGIGHGVLWRGLGGEAGQQGDLFRWHAPDGRSILLHHLPPDGYEAGSGLVDDAPRLRQAWAGLKPALLERAATSHLAVPVGADHHAAPAAIGRVRDLLAALEPDADVRVSRLDEYFRAAEAQSNGVPTLHGELRWSYGYTWTLQGVHATRAPLKRRHAEVELLLERVAEPLAALAGADGRGDRRPLLRDAWRALVRSQFHDSIAAAPRTRSRGGSPADSTTPHRPRGRSPARASTRSPATTPTARATIRRARRPVSCSGIPRRARGAEAWSSLTSPGSGGTCWWGPRARGSPGEVMAPGRSRCSAPTVRSRSNHWAAAPGRSGSTRRVTIPIRMKWTSCVWRFARRRCRGWVSGCSNRWSGSVRPRSPAYARASAASTTASWR